MISGLTKSGLNTRFVGCKHILMHMSWLVFCIYHWCKCAGMGRGWVVRRCLSWGNLSRNNSMSLVCGYDSLDRKDEVSMTGFIWSMHLIGVPYDLLFATQANFGYCVGVIRVGVMWCVTPLVSRQCQIMGQETKVVVFTSNLSLSQHYFWSESL